jgi:cytochrome P450
MRFFDEPLTQEEQTELVERFDHTSPAFRKNPFEAYRLLREHCPVAHSDACDGFWIPTTFEAVTRLARDDVNFSSAIHSIPQFPDTYLPPISFDPPESTEYRRMVTTLFSPPAVKAMEPRLKALAKEAMDAFIHEGKGDLVQDFARHVTYKNVIWLTGLPMEKADAIMNVVAGGILGTLAGEAYLEGMAFVHAEVLAAIQRHKEHPVPGTAITHLVHNVSIFEGRKPTDQEIEGSVMLMLAGGSDTTVGTSGTAFYYLGEHPEARQKLIDNPELLDTALDEFLRFASPTHALARVAATDCTLGNVQVRKGERVLLPWAAGNWDATEFPNPDQIQLDRFPNRHLSFGVGSHRCLGSHLARVMLNVMLTEVLTRIPDYMVNKSGVRKSPSANVVLAFINLPVTFSPREI